MTSKSKNIKYGEVDIEASEFEPRHVKVRVTTMIDEDILLALKEIAEEKGHKYQTLLNQVLRNYVTNRGKPKVYALTEKRVRSIIKEELRKKA